MLAEVQLGLGDYAVIGGMMAAINGVVLAYVRSVSGRVDRMEVRLVDVEKKKTDKFDWARETLLVRGKLNDVSEQIANLSGKFETNIAFAAAFARLADELAELRKLSERKASHVESG